MRLRVVLALVLLAATSAPPAFAQITSATISGTVKDETGGVLPGVDVVIRNVETGLTRSVVTDPNGYFTVPGLAPGTYEARATLQGFTTAVQSGIVLGAPAHSLDGGHPGLPGRRRGVDAIAARYGRD